MKTLLKTLSYSLLVVWAFGTLYSCCPKVAAPISESRDTSVFLKDSTVITYSYRDSTHVVYIPRDSVRIRDSINCKIDYTNKVKSKSVYASVRIRNGLLEVDCDTDSLFSLLVKTRDSLTTITSKRQDVKTITITKTYKVKVPTPYIPAFFWWLLAIAVAALVFVVVRFWPSVAGFTTNLFGSILKLFGKK